VCVIVNDGQNGILVHVLSPCKPVLAESSCDFTNWNCGPVMISKGSHGILEYKPGVSNSADESVKSIINEWAGNRAEQCTVTCDSRLTVLVQCP